MKNLKLFFCSCFFAWASMAFSFTAFAQATVNDAYARLLPQNNGTLYDGVFTVEVSDTSTISQIEVKLGTLNGLADLVNSSFSFDVNTGLPSGYSFLRRGKVCTIRTSDVSLSDAYYGEVRIQSNGNWSAPYKFVGN